ncbi:GFA family protein [Paracoccus alkanivorans]|uniref:GFA family protein n=1 Tax=Paracoccus alkanivorans TaxID=2116655 RepID=A0A3M0M7S8_9RHOB|nr:GFA family protein [Paracoccus alkanivorans]RMC33848.1 GFA family protein [Paracoccus alkanivorans]
MTGLNAQCLCGAVRFSAVPRAGASVCHCSMCRKWTGGINIAVDLAEAPVFQDEAKLGVYRSSEWAERLFCTECGSSLLYRTVDDAHYVASAGCFDDPSQFPLESEIFIDEKPSSYDLAGERPRMTGAEFMAMVAPEQEAD